MHSYGLTGGVGMGKSTCADLLRTLAFPVVDTDDLAREAVRPGQPALAEIVSAFGPSVLDDSGSLRRQAVAQIVFADPSARKALEAILHPRITAMWLARMDACRADRVPAVAVVIPLLFETGAETHFDTTVCLACSPATQLARLAARGWSPEETASRISAQMPVEDKMARADHVIWTEGSLDALASQVNRIFFPLDPRNCRRNRH